MKAPNYCLVGRWLRYMPEGTFRHSNIASARPKSVECTVRWIAYSMTGIISAVIFVAFVGSGWIQHLIMIPSITLAALIVAASFFIMAASGMSNPLKARLRSLMNPIVFGVGIYPFGLLIHCLT